MVNHTGSNIQDIKLQNRMLILKLIATNHGFSRVDLAKVTGLSKMAVGKIVSELITCGMVNETERTIPLSGTSAYGRRPIMLTMSQNSPCICGMLIKRGLCQIVLANLDGSIFEQINIEYIYLENKDNLIEILKDAFLELKKRTNRRILAIGISSLGPIDSSKGIILSPPYFYGIENLPIASIMEEITSLPTYLVNDANAGALAEKLYGIGKNISNFTYLHIMNGIGAGFILHNTLYNGDSGQSGEIGHTSINFSGPKCDCGNTGCLDLYANINSMRNRIKELEPFYKNSPLLKLAEPSWCDFVDSGNSGDSLAITILDEFCSYISYALVDTLNLLDLSNIIVGYDSNTNGMIIEKILERKISKSILSSKFREITLLHSGFDGNAPLIGSIATIADKIFSKQLSLEELELPDLL